MIFKEKLISLASKIKFKEFFVRTTLLLSSIYIPLTIFSALDYYRKKNIQSRKYIYNTTVINQTLNAVKENFLPTFFPISMITSSKKLEFFPIGSLPYQNSYYCDEGYGLVTFKTDRFGLRNEDNKWDNLFDQPNVFVLGDSFTHGACVDDKNTIPSIIEKSTKLNTINLGMGGNGPYNYLAAIKSLVKPIINKSKFNNKIVINFYADDYYNPNYYEENFHKRNNKLLKNIDTIVEINQDKSVLPTQKYIENLENFINKNYPMEKEQIMKEITKKKVETNFKNSGFYQITTLVPIRYYIKILFADNYAKDIQSLSSSKKVISLISQICLQKCEVYISIIPSSNYWDPHINLKKYKKELSEISRQKGVIFLDGEEVIDINNQQNYAPKGLHFSKKAFESFGMFIASKIKG